MRTPARATLAFAFALKVFAQGHKKALDRDYSLLRENENWSFLADSASRNDFWDPIKYVPLGTHGSYVSLGGEVRESFEQVGNDNWGRQNFTNAFFMPLFNCTNARNQLLK